MAWVRVTKKQKCPICEKPDWCVLSDDGAVACCMRVTSEKVLRNGGWLHRLGVAPQGIEPTVARRRAPAITTPAGPSVAIDWEKRATRYRSAVGPDALGLYAKSLGVTAPSLARLDVGYAEEHRAFTFPMRDARDRVCGIHLRCTNGRKLSIKGSRLGLFVPDRPEDREIYICEGPSDAAALLDAGVIAIGRPGITTCVDILLDWIERGPYREAVVMGDWDVHGRGQQGAERIATLLIPRLSAVKLIYPPHGKDVRQWSPSPAALRAIVSQAPPLKCPS